MPKQTKRDCENHVEIISLITVLILLFISMRKLFGLIGFLGGALFGLMFASKSGKEMRKNLAKGKDEEVLPKLGKELAEAGKNFASAVKEAADEPEKEMIKKGQKKGNEIVKQVKSKIKKAGKTVKKATKSNMPVKKRPIKKAGVKKTTKKK